MSESTGTIYNEITENLECIDTLMHYARYQTEAEESIWVCEQCEEVGVDPYERDCDCYNADVEGQGWCG